MAAGTAAETAAGTAKRGSKQHRREHRRYRVSIPPRSWWRNVRARPVIRGLEPSTGQDFEVARPRDVPTFNGVGESPDRAEAATTDAGIPGEQASPDGRGRPARKAVASWERGRPARNRWSAGSRSRRRQGGTRGFGRVAGIRERRGRSESTSGEVPIRPGRRWLHNPDPTVEHAPSAREAERTGAERTGAEQPVAEQPVAERPGGERLGAKTTWGRTAR